MPEVFATRWQLEVCTQLILPLYKCWSLAYARNSRSSFGPFKQKTPYYKTANHRNSIDVVSSIITISLVTFRPVDAVSYKITASLVTFRHNSSSKTLTTAQSHSYKPEKARTSDAGLDGIRHRSQQITYRTDPDLNHVDPTSTV